MPYLGEITSFALLYPASPDSLPYLFIGTAARGVWAYRVPEVTGHPALKPVYYPLATGNTWFYNGWYPQWKVIGDTVLQDGRHYARVQENHYFTTRLERQQGDSVYWDGALLYDFERTAGEVLSLGDRSIRYVGAAGDTLLFGRTLRWWLFGQTWLGPFGGGESEIVVDSLGMVYHDEGGDLGWNESILKGAIIDGKKYGIVDAIDEGGASKALPGETCLLGNYPNPFNPRTTIKYTVGVASGRWQVSGEAGGDQPASGLAGGRGSGARVKLAMYDLLGREVAVLVNDTKQPGAYQVTFDGSALASGLYFYRMEAGSFVATKKLLLLK